MTFVNVPDAIVHDWRYGKGIAGLAVTVPKNVGWGITGPRIEPAVSIDAAKVQFVVVTESNLKPYFYLRRHREFFTVTNHGVRRNEYGRDSVLSETWPHEQSENDQESGEGLIR